MKSEALHLRDSVLVVRNRPCRRRQRFSQSLCWTLVGVVWTTRREPPSVHAFPLVSHPVSSLRSFNPTRTAVNIATASPFKDLYDPIQFERAAITCSENVVAGYDQQQQKQLRTAISSTTSPPSTLETWKRRLVTKEDKFHIHKITGICFMLTSTLIMAGGMITKFKIIPAWLHSATLLLVVSGWLQLYTSVTMTRQFRSRNDEKAAFLVTAIGSSLTNLLALWFSPFCPSMFLRHAWVPHGIVALNTLCLWTPTWSFMAHPSATIQNRQEPAKPDVSTTTSTVTTRRRWNIRIPSFTSFSQLRDAFAYYVQIPIINVAASRMILQLHAQGRDFFLTSWVLPGTPAQNMANIFYSMVFLSMASNYVALTATLRDKHLISQAAESKIMAVLGAVSVFLMTRAMF